VEWERPALSKYQAPRRACPGHLDELDAGNRLGPRQAQQQAKLRAIFSDLQRALGMRVAQAVGTRKRRLADSAWRKREGE
jgi:hypothetical protein